MKIVDEYLTHLKSLAESNSTLILMAFFIKYLVEAKLKEKVNEIKVNY